MNIFVLDKDPRKAAAQMCDQHVVKMLLESAQLLCLPFDDPPYKPTHQNHPCSKWVLESDGNYEWLLCHATALCIEYRRRYDKQHKSRSVIQWCGQNYTGNLNPSHMYVFPQCMPDEFKVDGDPVKAYRNYYQHKYNEWRTKHAAKPQYQMRYKLNNWPEWLSK